MIKFLRRIAPYIVLWYLLGSLYLSIEGAWRGWTHISMMAVGGICGLCIGTINQFPRFYNMRIVWQSLLGAITILIIEFISGCILNLWLKLGVWNYSELPFNLFGQVCLLYGLIWVGLTPFAIWAEDKFRWLLYYYFSAANVFIVKPHWKDYSLISIYKDLFHGR